MILTMGPSLFNSFYNMANYVSIQVVLTKNVIE